MSFIETLAQKGINFAQDVGKVVTTVGTRAGIVPVEWPRERRPGLVWKIPEPETIPASERVTTASIFAKNQPVVVREYERALVLENGKLYAELPPGMFEMAKAPVKGIVEIIWVTMSQSQHRWGVGGVLTQDGITVGAFGNMLVQIQDATKFILSLVCGQQAYTEDKIEAWIKNLMSGIMRRELALRDVRSLMVEREAFIDACREKLTPLFAEWGLLFKHMEVVELNVPPEYRDALKGATLAGFGRQTALINAQTEAEMLQIRAQAQANARLMAGSADVQVMALMQAQGLDAMKIQMINTLMEYAKTPSGGAGGALVSGDLYKPQVFAMLAQALMDPSVPADIKQTLRQSYPQQAALPAAPPVQTPPDQTVAAVAPAPVPAPASPPASPAAQTAPEPSPTPAPEPALTAEKVQQTLDNLDMQLAEGKISETMYNRLREKWEGKLLIAA